MYQRGENLFVQTPDFVEFANDISHFSSRNQLIFKSKLNSTNAFSEKNDAEERYESQSLDVKHRRDQKYYSRGNVL